MARDIANNDVQSILNALKSMYQAANYAANASSMTVIQLRDVIDQLQFNYNKARSNWGALVSLVGGAQARAAIADRLAPTPADVGAALSAIEADVLAVINAYAGSVYASGSPAWTYSIAVEGNQITGGHSHVQIGAGVVSTINSLTSTLRTSLLALAPVE